jgi:CheY-like chemotaxis protein
MHVAYPPRSLSPALSKTPSDPPVIVLLAVAVDDVMRYPSDASRFVAAHTTRDAIAQLERLKPRVMVIDWDHPEVDPTVLCRRAVRADQAPLVMAITVAQQVPRALRAGCDAILLKPFAPNLAAARIGRLCREAHLPPALQAMFPRGTNRTWRDVACPSCGAGSAVAFDYASHRQSWYACLTCEDTWRGPTRE